jgi:hypothetical protein
MCARAICLAIGLVLSLTATGRCALVVNIGSLGLDADSSGTIDVTISADPGDPGELLAVFGFEFRITPSAAFPPPAGSSLILVDPQFELQLGDSNYVFDGISLAVNEPIPGGLGAVSPEGDTYFGGDTVDDSSFDIGDPARFHDVTVTAVPRLLVRLDVTNFGGVGGEEFLIDVVPTGTFFASAAAFGDPALDLIYSSNQGRVTIQGTVTPEPEPTVIPEPSTAIIWGLGLTAVGLFRRVRRR